MQRRDFFKKAALSAAGVTAISKLAFAAEICTPGTTPSQTKGPFYPQIFPLEKDADLVQTGTLGKVVIVEGVVTDQLCNPVTGALVEIWQACASGRYNHSADPNTAELDPNFQYWGRSITDAKGFYRFRTIIPGAYPADVGWDRPPHIHFKVARLGYRELITQMYFNGDPLNQHDKILQDLSVQDQQKVVVDFKDLESQPHPVGEFNIQIQKI